MATRSPSTSRPQANVVTVDVSEHPDFDESMDWKERRELELDLDEIRSHKRAKFNAIAGVYQVADSILTGNPITVQAGDFSNLEGVSKNAPAFNDGNTLFLNTEVLKDLTPESLLSLNGVNYHELSHLLFSPRAGSKLVKQVVESNLLQAYNILEDNRIETLLVAKYPSTIPSLTKATLEYLLGDITSNPDLMCLAFPLIRGRKYLPIEVRQQFADLFTAKFGLELAQQVASIIDEYRHLAFPMDFDRAYELVVAFNDCLREFAQDLPETHQNGKGQGGQGDEQGEGEQGQGQQGEQGQDSQQGQGQQSQVGNCDSRNPMKNGRAESGKKQQEIAERSKATDGQSEQLNDNSNPEQTTNDNDGDTNGGVNGGDTSPTSEQSPSNQDGNHNGTGTNLADLIKDTIADLMQSQQVKQEIKSTQEAIRNSTKGIGNLPKAKYFEYPIDPAYKTTAHNFGRELENLLLDNDPAWLTENPTGKLNVGRAMRMDINDVGTVFDRWDTGNDAFDIEAVVLVDNSGSMGGQIYEATQAMWTIKRALEEIDSSVTVMTFNHDSRLLYESGERVSPNTYRAVQSSGYTDPYEGLIEAEQLFLSSKRKTKLLFIISDGGWGNEQKCERTVERINSIDGTITNAVFLLDKYSAKVATPDYLRDVATKSQHKCDSISIVSEPKALVEVARNLIKALGYK